MSKAPVNISILPKDKDDGAADGAVDAISLGSTASDGSQFVADMFALFNGRGQVGAIAADHASVRHFLTQGSALSSAVSDSSGATGTASASLSVADTSDHIINATESASVAFTVSGLSAATTGAVTFTDSGNHQVVIDVQGNGAYSADLSTLTDGTITSSLSAAGPSGNPVLATGNAVTLDTDRGLTPTVSVNAVDPAHVTFTISGLEGDDPER